MAGLLHNRSGELEVFVRVIELGGFSAAERACGMTPSAVSKLVARLEQRLALAGLGLAHLAAFQVREDIDTGRLLPVLKDCNPSDLEKVHAVYVGQGGNLPLRQLAFLDFMAEQINIGRVDSAGQLQHQYRASAWSNEVPRGRFDQIKRPAMAGPCSFWADRHRLMSNAADRAPRT